MRYLLAALLLLAVLPVISVLAAPAPEPSAILDIGPPPKGETGEEHCTSEIDVLKCAGLFYRALNVDAEMRKLPLVARIKDPRPWLASNLLIKKEDGGRRLRLMLHSGNRADQVIILNALVRADLQVKEERIKFLEKHILSAEDCIVRAERHIKTELNRNIADSFRKGINDLRSDGIPSLRTEITHLKRFAVINWAR